MSDKHCNCGRCHCCNGYVQDANNPNRYVNLETGKVRRVDRKKWRLDWLILWLLIAFLSTNYGQSNTKVNSNQTKSSQKSLTK